MAYKLTVGISNKHVHLSQADLETLFGKGYQLTKTKDLNQPGQYATAEKVDVTGPKGTLKGLRILGPVRKQTQVELAATDARTIGIKCPVRLSGDLAGSAPITITGPCGQIELEEGAIIAMRHMHVTPEDAKIAGVVGRDKVSIRVGGERGLVFDEVAVRCTPTSYTEIHLDTDEANAAGVVNDQLVELVL